jgi:hypothetical protein
VSLRSPLLYATLFAVTLAGGAAHARLQSADPVPAPAANASAEVAAAPAVAAPAPAVVAPAAEAPAVAPIAEAPAVAPIAEAPAVAPAAAASPAAPAWMPPSQPGKGMVVIFRESRFVGAAVGMKFYADNGTALPKLGNGRVIHYYLEPGDHKLYGDKKKARDARILGVEPGETYFFEARIEMGMWKGSLDLVPVDRAEAIERISKLKHPAS